MYAYRSNGTFVCFILLHFTVLNCVIFVTFVVITNEARFHFLIYGDIGRHMVTLVYFSKEKTEKRNAKTLVTVKIVCRISHGLEE